MMEMRRKMRKMIMMRSGQKGWIGEKPPRIGNRTSALTNYWVVVHGCRRSSAATGSIPSSLWQCRGSGMPGSGRRPRETEKPAIGSWENRRWTAGPPEQSGEVALI